MGTVSLGVTVLDGRTKEKLCELSRKEGLPTSVTVYGGGSAQGTAIQSAEKSAGRKMSEDVIFKINKPSWK